jgi:hypothetical protein
MKKTNSAITEPHGYLYLAAHGRPTLKAPVSTGEQAVAIWSRYRDGQSGIDMLGSSSMKPRCGNIYSESGQLVARISYNGRIWNPQGEMIQDFIN